MAEHEAVSETYAVGAVAQRVGVPSPTLRTWERRYGLGPNARTSGGHRRYTAADVAKIAAMHRLITAGLTPQAAAAAVSADHSEALAGSYPAAAGDAAGSGHQRRIRGLVRAAQDFDALRLEEAVTDSLRRLGVVECWTDILVPMLRVVGDRWASGQLGVESEHLASACVAGALAAHSAATRASITGPARVLLACTENETHALPLVALQVALLESGLRSHLLGAAVPNMSLAAAVRRTGPSVLFLWSSRAATADPGAYRSLPVRRRPVPVVLGGPGWDRLAVAVDVPGVRVVDTLPAAVELLAGMVEG